jgi:hypothetical protein
MVDKLDIIELRKVKDDKQKRRVKIYEEILKNCHNRIIMHSNEENDCCFYKVPEFKFGIPIYNLNSCIAYIIYKLRNNGFTVKYIYPNYLFISWKKSESEKERETLMLTEELPKINEHIPINRNKIKGNDNDSYFRNLSSLENKNIYDDSTLNNFKITTKKMNKNNFF